MLKINKIPESIESKFSSLAKSLNRKKKIKYSLGLGEPEFPTPNEIISECFRSLKNGNTRYSNPLGIFELRQKLAKISSKKYKFKISSNNIIVTPGSKMALSFLFSAILKDKSEILYFSPAYTSYVPQMLIANYKIKIHKLNLTKNFFKINFSELKKKLNKRTKIILFNYPHNPTGQILSKEEYEILVQTLKKYPNCYLLFDKIYDELNFSKLNDYSLELLNKFKKNSIIINGFSKNFSMTGWRIGYCIAEKELIKKMSILQQHMITNVPVFIQHASLKALDINKKFLKNYNNNLNRNFKILKQLEADSNLIKVSPSSGGLFAFVNISKTKLKSDFFSYNFLKKYLVATTPGIFFGKNWNNYIRISLAINCVNFQKAISLLRIFLKKNEK